MGKETGSAVQAASQPSAVELSVVMPCLNEAGTVAGCVQKACAFFERHEIKGEVIVADNGSHDDSATRARDAGARVVFEEARGYGAAVMAGVQAAQGRYIIMGDADASYDFSALEPFLEALRAGADLVMGNRFRGGIAPGAMPWLHRYLGNPLLSAVGRVLFKSPVGDFHCGLRGFPRASVKALELRTTGMEFASEMVVKATLQGQRIVEVPTPLYPDGRAGRSHLNTWRDGWRHLRFMLLHSPRWLFLYPGLFLITLGFTVGASLLPGVLYLGRAGLDVSTLVYASFAILVGFQSVCFSVFAKKFAIRERLLPADPKLERYLGRFLLRLGAPVGVALVLVGLAGSFYAVHHWSLVSYGPLDPQLMIRIVVPSGTALTLGVQLIFANIFLNMLTMGTR